MKVHVGADVNSGLVHTVSVTPANVSDINQLPHQVREDDRAVFGDKGYVNNKLKRLVRKAGLFWGVSLKASKQHPLTEAKKRFNHKMSSIGARVEHVFRVIKRKFGYTKVRYKGICEERRTAVLADRFDQSLSCEARLDELMGEIRPLRPKTGARGQNGLENNGGRSGTVDHRSRFNRLAWVSAPKRPIDLGFPRRACRSANRTG